VLPVGTGRLASVPDRGGFLLKLFKISLIVVTVLHGPQRLHRKAKASDHNPFHLCVNKYIAIVD
jgi:hypothetical protein